MFKRNPIRISSCCLALAICLPAFAVDVAASAGLQPGDDVIVIVEEGSQPAQRWHTEITEIDADGFVTLKGEKTITVARSTWYGLTRYTITEYSVTGRIHQLDLSVDRIVSSSEVANLTIEKSSRTKNSWFGRNDGSLSSGD